MLCAKSLATSFAAAMIAIAAVPAQADPRLVTHDYSEDEVVRIDGKLGVQATIGFDDNETIENVAVGDSQKWQITPNKRADLLFLKPLDAAARTNMTVVTNKRTYFFDLVASPGAKPIYMLQFAYGPKYEAAPAAVQAQAPPAVVSTPDPAALATFSAATEIVERPVSPVQATIAYQATVAPREDRVAEQVTTAEREVVAIAEPEVAAAEPALSAAEPEVVAAAEPALAAAEPEVVALASGEQFGVSGGPNTAPAAPAVLNFAWVRKGDAELLPVRIYDDGEATYLSWNAMPSLPAILVRNEEGVEGPASFAVRGNTIVISAVPALIVLRSGESSATLQNLRADAAAYGIVPPGPQLDLPRYSGIFDLPFADPIRRY